ncbi:glutamate--tRNA ligase [Candidatus Palauibacter sp.]|uniref:glutamate--tRNA ligase n=1 Tax=Candidatus Palauibacter sp. TaxID=3101350 RepID=UPI003B01C2F5
MTAPIRTRFAPSPTGALHLGNARTAILNWLFARRHGGAFVLRLEDTDTERGVPGGEAMIYEALDWLGLGPDEGPREGGPFGPYRQSERGALHRERARELLESGCAFRCYCAPDELEARREAAIAVGEPTGRDARCRDLPADKARRYEAAGRTPAIRLRVASGPVEFDDFLKGTLAIDGDDLGDMVLVRSDGRPTYNFAVAVDDIAMEISHVIRGVGHLSNTPKQVLLYRAFGVEPPEFVHIPTVLAPGGGKLSKRRGAAGVLDYRERGFHPDAILNYLSLLSWSSEDGEEFLSREALVERIDLDRLGAADSEVDEEKMAWLSGRHLRAEPPERLARRWAGQLDAEGLGLTDADLRRAAEVFAKRTRLVTDAPSEVEPIFRAPPLGGAAARQVLWAPEAGAALRLARAAWEETAWRPEALARTLRGAMREAGLPGRAFFPPVRVALTGQPHGPDLGEVAYALGRERTLERLDAAATGAAGEFDTSHGGHNNGSNDGSNDKETSV